MDVYLTELVRYLATQSWQIAALTLATFAICFGSSSWPSVSCRPSWLCH